MHMHVLVEKNVSGGRERNTKITIKENVTVRHHCNTCGEYLDIFKRKARWFHLRNALFHRK